MPAPPGPSREKVFLLAYAVVALALVGAAVTAHLAGFPAPAASVGEAPMPELHTVAAPEAGLYYLGNSTEAAAFLVTIEGMAEKEGMLHPIPSGDPREVPTSVIDDSPLLVVDGYWYSRLTAYEKDRVKDALVEYWVKAPYPAILALGPDARDIVQPIQSGFPGAPDLRASAPVLYQGVRWLAPGLPRASSLAGDPWDGAAVANALPRALQWASGSP